MLHAFVMYFNKLTDTDNKTVINPLITAADKYKLWHTFYFWMTIYMKIRNQTIKSIINHLEIRKPLGYDSLNKTKQNTKMLNITGQAMSYLSMRVMACLAA